MHVSCNMFLLISSVCSDKLAQSGDTVDTLISLGVKKQLGFLVMLTLFSLFMESFRKGRNIHKSFVTE